MDSPPDPKRTKVEAAANAAVSPPPRPPPIPVPAATPRRSTHQPLNTFGTTFVPSASRASAFKLAPLPPPPALAGTGVERSAEYGNARAGPSSARGGGGGGGSDRKPRILQPMKGSPLPLSRPLPLSTPTLKSLPSFSLPTDRDTPLVTPSRPLKPLPTPSRSFLSPTRSSALSSPPKPLLTTPPSERASLFFDAIPRPRIKLESGTKVSDLAPSVPELGSDWNGEDWEGRVESWSPRKRRGGYLTAGLASQAAHIISTTRTSQTLWIHLLSRSLSSFPPLSSLPMIERVLAPVIKLSVLEIVRGRKERGRYWEESKSLLLRCKIILRDDTVEEEEEGEGEEEGMEGLVLLSLGSNPPFSSINLPPPPPPLPASPAAGRGGKILIPKHAGDLRRVGEGSQVWVWEPFHQVVLPSSDQGSVFGKRMRRRVKKVGEVEEGEEGVVWDTRGVGVREREKEEKIRESEEVVVHALVCARFGIVN